MTDLGKIAYVPKGDYSAAAQYEYLDVVHYNGASYSAKRATTGHAPTTGKSDDTYWQLMVSPAAGVFRPMGTVAFASLPTEPDIGDCYNISDSFTTDNRFKEGSGIKLPAGTNVYYTTDGYWDVLAGKPIVSTINGMKIDGTDNVNNYGVCSTAAATAAKTVSITGNFSLVTGAEVTVKFSNSNSATNPTLNVNSTGAKAIYFAGAAVGTSDIVGGLVYSFRYNGTQWDLVGGVSSALTSRVSTVESGKAAKDEAIKNITRSGTTFTATRADGTTFTFTQQDNNTWTAMVGATSSANGSVGYVNAVPPKDGYNTKYLRADGTWTVPPNTTTGTTYTAGNVPANTTFATNGSVKNAYDGLNSAKQPKTMSTTIAGQTTVEGCLDQLNTDIISADSYVICSTPRSTAAKVVALTGFALKRGATIKVRFTDTGSSNPSSGNLTLNVNSTGAKTIVDGHSNNTTMTYASAGYFFGNVVCEFVYDGTSWVWLNRDTNTTYTGATMKTSVAKTGSGSTVTNTIATSTSLNDVVGTLLNNDHALNTHLSEKASITQLNTKQNKEWNHIADSVNGARSQAYNLANYEEVKLCIYGTVNGTQLSFTESFPKEFLSSSRTLRGAGGYGTELDCYQISINNTNCKMDGIWINGTSILGNSLVQVYAR